MRLRWAMAVLVGAILGSVLIVTVFPSSTSERERQTEKMEEPEAQNERAEPEEVAPEPIYARFIMRSDTPERVVEDDQGDRGVQESKVPPPPDEAATYRAAEAVPPSSPLAGTSREGEDVPPSTSAPPAPERAVAEGPSDRGAEEPAPIVIRTAIASTAVDQAEDQPAYRFQNYYENHFRDTDDYLRTMVRRAEARLLLVSLDRRPAETVAEVIPTEDGYELVFDEARIASLRSTHDWSLSWDMTDDMQVRRLLTTWKTQLSNRRADRLGLALVLPKPTSRTLRQVAKQYVGAKEEVALQGYTHIENGKLVYVVVQAMDRAGRARPIREMRFYLDEIGGSR